MKKQIDIPKVCFTCFSPLELVNSQLFCRNKDCAAQSTKRLEAFVKKIGIKGLGPANLDKLEITHPTELYECDKEYFTAFLGEKVGLKIFDEIERSRNVPFSKFLSALSIPLIGDTASKKVAEVANSIDGVCSEDIPLGEKAKDNFHDWLFDNEWVFDLEKEFSFQQVSVVEKKGNVCITGKLKEFSNRNEAKEILEKLGYTVTSTVSSKTDYLVDEEGKPSSKRKKAESLGIPIVSIENLLNG